MVNLSLNPDRRGQNLREALKSCICVLVVMRHEFKLGRHEATFFLFCLVWVKLGPWLHMKLRARYALQEFRSCVGKLANDVLPETAYTRQHNASAQYFCFLSGWRRRRENP